MPSGRSPAVPVSGGARYDDLDDIAWYAGDSGGSIHRVRMKEPNAWGLFDMLGGVWEWCWDLYDPGDLQFMPRRTIRGGGWSNPEWSCRAGVRRKTNPPTAKLDDLGFRLARGAIPEHHKIPTTHGMRLCRRQFSAFCDDWRRPQP